MDWGFQLAVGFLVPIIAMVALWYFVGRDGKAGWVDVAWAALIGLSGLYYASTSWDGNWLRRLAIAVCILTWATRLAAHLFFRLRKEADDARYLDMMEQWGAKRKTKLLFFYLIQAVTVIGFSLPLWLGSHTPAQWSFVDWLAVSIWCVSISGEALADFQLKRFKADPDNKGETCDVGLWRYSRHPNYFFEWLHWFTYVAFARTAPWGWLTAMAPMLMLYFVLFVTGVGPAEKQSLKSRPESYRRYQKKTSVFFPWPPKQHA